jgi:hypothetical protein
MHSQQETRREAGRPKDFGRISAAILVALAWFALTVRFSFSVYQAVSHSQPVGAALVRFFSFFTIETNLLLATVLTISVVRSQADHVMLRPSVKSAVTAYIIIVGLVYAILLRHLAHLQGLQLFADNILHVAIPILYPLYWLAFVPKKRLQWSDPFLWLIFPLAYFVYTLLRGAAFGIYPYPFFDVAKLGYARVSVNALILLGVFCGVGLIVTAIDHARGCYQTGRRSQLGRAAEF